ncbi:hypothetical protein HK100_000716 [Physocladia obscura]|uniref:Uncharacterized protein n=1 Tax=Physocladia obscura TaxID=109957 RepID=A0AAD5XGR0_9FUNG|nr:hypothetical protein HK100_000716 [Physocladia obscura]
MNPIIALIHCILAASFINAVQLQINTSQASALVIPSNTIQTMEYRVDNTLSSGSSNIFVYIEPGHILVNHYQRPFKDGMICTFNYTVPAKEGPYLLVFYDVQASGTQSFPSISVITLQISAGNISYWGNGNYTYGGNSSQCVF